MERMKRTSYYNDGYPSLMGAKKALSLAPNSLAEAEGGFDYAFLTTCLAHKVRRATCAFVFLRRYQGNPVFAAAFAGC